MLREILRERGLRLEDVDFVDPWAAGRQLRGRHCILALGDDAAAALIPSWQGTVQERRGYIFETAGGIKVVPSVHPEFAAKSWVPWRMLLSYDVERAKEENKSAALNRPAREVYVPRSAADAERCAKQLRAAGSVACDIEIYDSSRISCVGFAASASKAVVFPPRYLEAARSVLLDPSVSKVFQNGQFDLHFLLTREGIRVAGSLDDTMVAWHACYPELAGSSIDASGNRKSKTTRKSLAFFGSLFTRDAWWKDYDFKDDMEMYVLNGRDCCVTYDIFHSHLAPLVEELNVSGIYRHEIRLLWPVVEMQALGLHINEELRQERIAALTKRIDDFDDKLDALVLPLLEERWDSLPEETQRLFAQRRRCDCCLNAGRKAHCWSCTGFSKEPKKQELIDCLNASGVQVDPSFKKADLLQLLPPCSQCEGAGEFHWLAFNGRSVPQKQALLFDVLKLPKRYKNEKLSTDEEALRGLLAHVS